MGLASIPNRIRSLPRLPQIVRVLAKYGFGDVTARIGLDSFLHALRSWVLSDVDPRLNTLSTEARLRLMLEDLGPTFVKLGQVMATRPDMIPMSLIQELRKLQDKVKPFDTAGIRAHVEAELARPIAEVFSEFDDQPLAAASIAQVHLARLKDGRKVVLKIQRPNLERVIETDLVLLYWLAELAEERLPELRRYQPVQLVSEFHRSILKEIDFETEAYHIRRFAKNFAGDPDVYVPAVIEELTTPRILCEEFIQGTKLNDPTIHTRQDIDLVKVARTGIRVVIEQALVHGFFHADPHPGNLFVLPGNKICMIDFGMMGILDQERIDELLQFLVSILTRDVEGMLRLFARLELLPEDLDQRGLGRDVDDLICRFQSVELGSVDLGKFLNQVFDVITRHQVKVPADLLLVGKALATIEGVGRDIYPELNTVEEVRPHILRIWLRRMADPGYHARGPRRAVQDGLLLLETAPRDLRLALRKLRAGELGLKLELDDLRAASRAHSQATNRLALAILVASLALSAAYLIPRSDLSGWMGDFPLMALMGLGALATGFLLALGLLVGYVRSGGL